MLSADAKFRQAQPVRFEVSANRGAVSSYALQAELLEKQNIMQRPMRPDRLE